MDTYHNRKIKGIWRKLMIHRAIIDETTDQVSVHILYLVSVCLFQHWYIHLYTFIYS